jgi:hypothetical protein
MAWMAPAELRDRIMEMPVDLRARVDDYLRSYGPAVRRRGYTVGLEDPSPERRSLTQDLAERPNDAGLRETLLGKFFDDQPNYAVLEVDSDIEYDVGNIAAPVFDPDGRVAFCLTLLHLGTLHGNEIAAAAQPVTASAQLLTRKISGRAPTHDWNETL